MDTINVINVGGIDKEIEDTVARTSGESADSRLDVLEPKIAIEITNRTNGDAALQTQIDQIVAPTGEAPNPAEIENARIGYDNTIYDTLGIAIRTQVSNLKNDFSKTERYMSEQTDNLIDNLSDVLNLWVNTSSNKIGSLADCKSVVIPVDPSISKVLNIYRGTGSWLVIGNLDTTSPASGDFALNSAGVTVVDHHGTWNITDSTVAILVWYYYGSDDSSVDPTEILQNLCITYGVAKNSFRDRVPYGYGEFKELTANNFRSGQLLDADSAIVEHYYINSSTGSIKTSNDAYSVIIDLDDYSNGDHIYVHKKYAGSIGIATSINRPANNVAYNRLIQASIDNYLNLNDYDITLQDNERYLILWFYYHVNEGTVLENLHGLYVGDIPFQGTYNMNLIAIDRDTVNYNESNMSPISYNLYSDSNLGDTGVYVNNYVYPVGHVKKIKTATNSENDTDIYAFIINAYNGVILRKYSTFGHGEIEFIVDEYIGVPFYLAVGGENCSFNSVKNVATNFLYLSFTPTLYRTGDTINLTFGKTANNTVYSAKQLVVYESFKNEIYKQKNTNCRNELFVAGDSITAGHSSYVVGNHWWEAICRKYNMVGHPAARTGAGFSYFTNINACKIAHDYDFSDMDVAIFAFGTNDYGNDIPIGTIDDVYTYSEDSSQTFYACIKYVIETVKTKNPKCTLILSLPINRSDHGTLNSRYGYGTANNAGATLLDYCDAIIACCEFYGVSYIDNRRGSFDLYALNTLLADGLHPTVVGYKCLGSDMIAKFGAIYQPFIEYDGKNGYGAF